MQLNRFMDDEETHPGFGDGDLKTNAEVKKYKDCKSAYQCLPVSMTHAYSLLSFKFVDPF